MQWDDSNQYISVYGYFNITQDRYNCGRPTYGIRDSNGRCCYSRFYRRDNTYHESAGWVNYSWSSASHPEKLGVTYADADNTRGVFSFRAVTI